MPAIVWLMAVTVRFATSACCGGDRATTLFGVNYFFASTTTISPGRRQLLSDPL